MSLQFVTSYLTSETNTEQQGILSFILTQLTYIIYQIYQLEKDALDRSRTDRISLPMTLIFNPL